MAEDKIVIKTKPRYFPYSERNKEPSITFDSLSMALAEVYCQAAEIGWETKSLQALTEWIQSARAYANNP